MVSKSSPRIIYLPQFPEDRGNLVVCEANLHVPFEIKRVFWIFDVPDGVSRAGHSHKNCEQLILAIRGSFKVYVEDSESDYYILDDPHEAIYAPSGTYIRIGDLTPDAVCLVICSEHYSEEDYVRTV